MGNRQVLVVDDEAGVRASLRRWIEAEGWSVQEAGSAEAALDASPGTLEAQLR